MDSIAAQPIAPASTRHPTSRFSHLLRPLRKSTSAKDLKKVANYTSSSSAAPLPFLNVHTSPLDDTWQSSSRSPTNPNSPPISFGFTSNKPRNGRGKSHDSDYIPYRGPISPPSTTTYSSFAHHQQQKVDEQRVPPVQLYHGNLSGLEGAFSVRKTTINAKPNREQEHREKPASIPKFNSISGLGLDGLGNLPLEATSSTSRYNTSALPSAYTHGGNAPLQSFDRSVANQSYLPSILRFDAPDSNSSISRQTREVQIRQPTFNLLSRVPVSPTIKHHFTQDRLMHDTKAASLSSSDGHHSSSINEGSRSTSMTSLRDNSSVHNGSKIRRFSHEGPPLSASAKLRNKIHASPSTTIESIMPSLNSGVPSTKELPSAPSGHFIAETSSEDGDLSKMIGKDSDVDGEIIAASPLSAIPASILGNSSIRPEASTTDSTHQRQEEAHQKYLLLQQLHLDEVKSHALNHNGYLEPNNGCERVLMPKPSLKAIRAAHGTSTSEAMAFERNRKRQTDYTESSSLSDAVRAQALYSGAEYSTTPRLTRGREDTPAFFHHRMPPATPTPDLNTRNATATSSNRPANVTIPPRRSSQSRKHRDRSRREVATPAMTSIQQPTCNVDNDSTPDLATVLAQGRALDEERERWRQQYHKSLLKARDGRSKSRESNATIKKVRYNETILPELSTTQDYVNAHNNIPIRQAKSTPDMRKSMSRGAYVDKTSNIGIASRCLAPFRDQPAVKQQPLQTHQDNQHQHLRQRSQSQDALSSSFKSSICFPIRSRRRRATTLESGEEKGKYPDPFRAIPTNDRQIQEKPIVISRQNASKERNVDGLSSIRSTNSLRFPSKTMPEDSDTQSVPRSNYGIAYSAPKPDISNAVATEDLISAGRHATKQQYHVRSNYDNSKGVLANGASEVQQQGEPKEERRVDSIASQLYNDDKLNSETSFPPGYLHENKSNQAKLAPLHVDIHPPTPDKAREVNVQGKGWNEVGNKKTSQQQQQKGTDKRQSKDNKSKRLTVQSISGSSDSNYSPHSVAARELWTTDEHTEEAFQSLFVRRPGAAAAPANHTTSTGLPQLATRGFSTSSSTTPRISGPVSKEGDDILVDDSTIRESLYRASLDTRRDSAHIEMLVGSYLSTLSSPRQTQDNTIERSSMQESDIDLYQRGIRLGRVGSGRTPAVISPTYHLSREQDDDDDDYSDDEIENVGLTSPRERVDSFAASLVLASEDHSPGSQELDQAPFETAPLEMDGNSYLVGRGQEEEEEEEEKEEEVEGKQNKDRLSEESIAKMVQDYVWPDPPSKRLAQ